MLGSLPVSPSLLPTIPHEQYRATIDVNQVIWDGGVTHSAREVEKVVNELNLSRITSYNVCYTKLLREQLLQPVFIIAVNHVKLLGEVVYVTLPDKVS